MFDAIATRYDFLNHLLSAGLDSQWRKTAVAALRLTGRETVLDLCTGTADLARAAAAAGAHTVIGIDFSGEMLRMARGKVRALPIALVRGDATRIPLADHSVDAVTIGFGIRNVEQPAAAYGEILRVLKRGGTLVILEFSLPRARIVRSFYLWYFRHVLPLIGRLVSRHQSAYTYLPESVEAFPSPDVFARQLASAGFGTVRAVSLTLGIVYMFVARKGGPSSTE